ncbi:hypothetical protein MMC10_004138 [Thelotrema lepadinum]|nr:hypothetical protein [Thelotrema lepadinum]
MTPPSLKVALVNQTSSNTVFAYITGLDIDHGNSWVIVKSDGGLYYPSSPSEILQPLSEDCGLALGNPGSSRTISIPHIAGGRIYFSIGKPLVLLLNPGPALVEPSPTNPSDPNYHTPWGFCEFTFNSAQLFANISYVDFVALPIALSIATTAGETKKVPGTGKDALANVCSSLEAQQAKDEAGWDSLIVKVDGKPLRALSPNNGIVLDPSLFENYWSQYIDDAWSKYANEDLVVHTQSASGQAKAYVSGDELRFSAGSYTKPSARDIFSCSTGPFANANPEMLAITPRLAAAINRSTLHTHANQPCVEAAEHYYANDVTNHYARIVHEVNLDRRGYAFPYDDVVPDGGSNVAGTIYDSQPEVFTVTVGGKNVNT